MAGCKPNCCTQPRAAPWGNDVALIKVSRSVKAACIMRGNAPCGVKGVMGYALSARGIFAQAQKCRMYQSRSTFPQGAALGYGQHLGLQPAPIIYRAFVQIGSFPIVLCPTGALFAGHILLVSLPYSFVFSTDILIAPQLRGNCTTIVGQ